LNTCSHISDPKNKIFYLAVPVEAAEPSPRHIRVHDLLEALGALLEWPAAVRQSPPPAQCTLREKDLLPLLEIPDLGAHNWADESDRPSLNAAAVAAAEAAGAPAAKAGVEPRNGQEIVREMDMLSLLLSDSDSQEPYTPSESAGSGPAAAVRVEAAHEAGSPPPPTTNSAAGQSGHAPPPADPENADPSHTPDTAAVDSDKISTSLGPAPAEQESELRRLLCRAESTAGGLGEGDMPVWKESRATIASCLGNDESKADTEPVSEPPAGLGPRKDKGSRFRKLYAEHFAFATGLLEPDRPHSKSICSNPLKEESGRDTCDSEAGVGDIGLVNALSESKSTTLSPARISAAGQSGQAPPPADPADADPGHAANTATADSDKICEASWSGPAPAERQESLLRRRLCLAESAASGMGNIPDQKPTAINEVESNSRYGHGE
jgi:hypothetical protein